eukprot:CAMPEP_0170549636 /NCGR_PEP_ID=MMETSP0211-20121228/7789_1 /TAXON_ID=311385 /ORGANISM="Pseudokeronopsis sp., Strain OXSARD2" /LENGTH=59 /DNA_ID=CAMNT_0010855773 /DNA_START=643 /DNA_END=822 /DNA_ORIENTATION=+
MNYNLGKEKSESDNKGRISQKDHSQITPSSNKRGTHVHISDLNEEEENSDLNENNEQME